MKIASGDSTQLKVHASANCSSIFGSLTQRDRTGKSSVDVGYISLNVHQMKLLNVGIDDEVSVKRFIAPAAFKLDWMSVDLESTDVNGGGVIIKASDLVQSFLDALNGQVLGEDQIVSLEHHNKLSNCTVIRVSIAGIRESVEGRLSKKTRVYFRPRSSQVEITGQQAIPRRAFQKNLNMDTIEQKLLSLGLGGMTSTFQQIVTRSFASRFMPDSLARTMDFKHVKGMVLYGPPGTGKTLVARTMAKIFDATVKVVNGPDLFNKYIGESERNVREIFGEAIEDHFKQGLDILLSSLSLDVGLSCLFEYPEETNSLAVQERGTSFGDGTGDRVVNQLLTMIDGFTELNNIFIIGTTNRLDLVDQAMLRFYNLRVIYICIASRTVGWRGAQLEAACNGALSIAIARSASGGLQFIREEDIKVLQSDFDLMIEEIDPAISKSVLQDLNKLSEKVVEGLEAFAEVEKGTKLLLKGNSKLTTCLLAGPRGSGKTTTAALMALKAKVQHVNMISLDPFQKLSEEEQCMKIVQIFENARTFQRSLIIVDDIELLLKYNSVIPYCSNNILQTLNHQLRIIPSKATKLLVIGTTSEKELLGKVGIADQFFIQIKIRSLQARDAREILQHLTNLQESDLDVVVELLDHIPIKKLYRLVDFASAAIVENTSGRREIELSSLLECMKFLHANM
ncbi:hypothetical protein RJ639_020301 [Escallonia herrerae]|uniref:Vesicle-fusing ATPase n=1 Tax=Escallonia herrerae TaxID=1293975 RepID=A0AA89AG09_9ASTE|nr:hypothetical protein RJ639_020301 [Escallonia herrerae]